MILNPGGNVIMQWTKVGYWKKMGWSQGDEGKMGDDITDPIRDSVRFARLWLRLVQTFLSFCNITSSDFSRRKNSVRLNSIPIGLFCNSSRSAKTWKDTVIDQHDCQGLTAMAWKRTSILQWGLSSQPLHCIDYTVLLLRYRCIQAVDSLNWHILPQAQLLSSYYPIRLLTGQVEQKKQKIRVRIRVAGEITTNKMEGALIRQDRGYGQKRLFTQSEITSYVVRGRGRKRRDSHQSRTHNNSHIIPCH